MCLLRLMLTNVDFILVKLMPAFSLSRSWFTDMLLLAGKTNPWADAIAHGKKYRLALVNFHLNSVYISVSCVIWCMRSVLWLFMCMCVWERESMRACVSRARCKLIPFYYVMLCFGEFQHSVTWTFLLSGNQRTSFTTGTQRERDFCLSFSLLTPTTAYLCSHADKLMYTVQLFQDHFVSLWCAGFFILLYICMQTHIVWKHL